MAGLSWVKAETAAQREDVTGRENVKTGAFRRFLTDEFVPALVETGTLDGTPNPGLHALDQATLGHAPNVTHDNPTDQRFHASLILGLPIQARCGALFDSGEIATLSGKLPELVSAAHAHDIVGALT